MIRRETVVALTLCTAASAPGAYMTTCFPAQF